MVTAIILCSIADCGLTTFRAIINSIQHQQQLQPEVAFEREFIPHNWA